MSTYSTLVEAWGCENFKNKKRKKKKRLPKKEPFQNYNKIHQGQDILNENGQNIYKSTNRRNRRRNYVQYNSQPSMNVNRMRNSRHNVEPIKIKLEDNDAEYDGYNSSDYDQYELEDDSSLTITSQNNGADDRSVMQEDYEPNETPYEECNTTYDQQIQQEQIQQEQIQQEQIQQSYQLDSNTIIRLYNILDKLENNTEGGENMYDVLLFIFFGVFILFIIDYMYKIGVKTSSNL